MPKVSDVLQWIGHDCGREALAYLCDQRALPRRQGKDAMRTQLARSYRGDLGVLIDDLRRKDLVTLLGSRDGVFVASHWFRLPNAGAVTLDDLRAAARSALINGKTADFVLGDGEDDEDDDDDQDDWDDDEDDAELDELSEDDEDDEEDEETLALKERLQAYSGRRSIEIRSLLRKAGLGEFERLRTERFQELIAMVEKAGYLVCDTNGAPYEDDDESPGIDARVLVLLRADDADEEDEDEVAADRDDGDHDDDDDDAEAEPRNPGPAEVADLESLATAGSCRLKRVLSVLGFGDLKRLKTARFSALLEQLADRGYDVFAPDGTHCAPGMPSPGIDARVRLKRRFAPTPISFVGKEQPPPAPVLRPVSDYEVAVARLKVLTGVPWVARRGCGDWPEQFMQLALDALALDDGQRRIISLLGEKVVTGVHDIEQPLALLRESQARGRLAALVDGFELLNDAAGADTAVVAAKMRARLGLTTAPPSDARSTVVPFPSEDARPIGRAAAPATGAASDAVNVRDLGALKGIFD